MIGALNQQCRALLQRQRPLEAAIEQLCRGACSSARLQGRAITHSSSSGRPDDSAAALDAPADVVFPGHLNGQHPGADPEITSPIVIAPYRSQANGLQPTQPQRHGLLPLD